MERSRRSSFIDKRAVQGAGRQAAVLLLLLIAAAIALPASAVKLKTLREMVANAVSGEDIAELGRREIAKSLEERLYWGGLVASVNPRLTSFEINEIGRAILRYSGEYGLPPKLIVAVITIESSGRVSAVSPKGAQGLMQIMPFWKSELGIEGTLFDIDTNIRAGTRILAEYIRDHGYREGIAQYYRGNLPVDADGYYGKLTKTMQAIS